jgi:hypothetical protein
MKIRKSTASRSTPSAGLSGVTRHPQSVLNPTTARAWSREEPRLSGGRLVVAEKLLAKVETECRDELDRAIEAVEIWRKSAAIKMEDQDE